MNPQTRAFQTLSALILTLNLANPVAAREPGQGFEPDRSSTVDSAGLDLSRLSDAETLYSRIRKAAHSVCRAEKAPWDGKAVSHQRRCIEEAIESAVARANQPLLTAVHRGRRERLADR